MGWQGLLQPFADVIKLMFKEELRPRAADPILFALAPIISAALFIVVFGFSLGARIKEVEGFPYKQFIVPGLIVMA